MVASWTGPNPSPTSVYHNHPLISYGIGFQNPYHGYQNSQYLKSTIYNGVACTQNMYLPSGPLMQCILLPTMQHKMNIHHKQLSGRMAQKIISRKQRCSHSVKTWFIFIYIWLPVGWCKRVEKIDTDGWSHSSYDKGTPISFLSLNLVESSYYEKDQFFLQMVITVILLQESTVGSHGRRDISHWKNSVLRGQYTDYMSSLPWFW